MSAAECRRGGVFSAPRGGSRSPAATAAGAAISFVQRTTFAYDEVEELPA